MDSKMNDISVGDRTMCLLREGSTGPFTPATD